MKVQLERSFPLPAPGEIAWAFLQNIEAVAGCMPGARVTERTDDRHYKGAVSVRVGPASMAFKGDIEVLEIDAAQRVLRLVGKGSDTSGTSGASMDLTARIEPGADGATSTLNGRSEVTMSGKGAAFGGRMMTTVADQILKDFAANFARQVQALAAAQTGTPASKPESSGPPASTWASTDGARASEPASPASNTPQAVPPAPPRELNALGLLWSILRDAVHGIFHRKPRADTRMP